MLNERDDDVYYKVKNDKMPFLVNLHDRSSSPSPYDWLIDSRRTKNINSEVLDLKPINFFFCAKHENSGKIESHLWFFKGFSAYTNVQFCQMIDAGTIPLK